MIGAPALVADNLFDLASLKNVSRVTTLSKQRMDSRYSRLAPTCIPGDLVFRSSKVYIFACVIGVWVQLRSMKKLAYALQA